MSNFQHPSQAKNGVISIASVDKPAIKVFAQYNPKELQIEKPVAWQKNPQANKSPGKGIQLEFTGAESRTTSVELTFDGFEQNRSVMPPINDLNTMASPLKAGSDNENERRPHLCVATWGEALNFRCVIESVSVKYTMFSEEGVPLRATATVKLKEADVVSMAKQDGK
jgi:hypothetical protein